MNERRKEGIIKEGIIKRKEIRKKSRKRMEGRKERIE